MLIVREHKRRWTRKGGQDVWVVKFVADMVCRTVQKLIFSQITILALQNTVVLAELDGSHDVIMEASPANERQSNGVVELAVQTVSGMIQITS